MNSVDLIEMIGNLSRSLMPVQNLLSGFAYLLGLVFMIIGLLKLKAVGSAGHSAGGFFVPVAYLAGASALFFLPSAVQTLSNTTFGTGNILQYTNFQPYDIQSSMDLLIRTAGLIWFMRGCVLLVHSSEPGVQHGPKGLTFLIAGILAMNFDNTIAFLTWLLGQITSFTLSIKNNQGY